MKTLLSLLLLVLVCATAQGQSAMLVGSGAPAGTCMSGQVTYRDITSGNFYDCVAGVWHLTTFSFGNVDNTSDANKPISTAEQTALNLKSNLNGAAFTGAVTSTVGLGYATGAGGAVVQATSKSTGVTLNKITGTITMNGAALAAATIVTFTVTDSAVAATDVIVAMHDSVGTTGAYSIEPNTPAAGSFKISVRNNTAGSLSEAIVIRFAVIKSVVN